MKIEQLALDASEQCPAAEIEAISRENAVFQLACFSGACAEVRADVFQNLQNHDAQREGSGWALYVVRPEDEEGDVTSMDGYKQVLLWTQPYPGAKEIEGHPIPIIRVITNEVVMGMDGTAEYLAHNITLDHEDDVQYAVDATKFREGINTDASEALLFQLNPETGFVHFNKRVEVFVPVEKGYCHEDGEMLSMEAMSLLPWFVSKPRSFELFGDFHRLRDKFDALELIKNVMKEIAALEPVCVRRHWLSE